MAGTDQPNAEVADQVADFDEWTELFARHGAFNHPCELHGALAGQLAAGERLSAERWQLLVAEHLGTDELIEASDRHAGDLAFLHAAYGRTLAALESEQMTFRPLLPDDRAPLSQRLEALSAWTRGFLEGMARAIGEQLGQAPDDVRELVRDFVAISQVEPEEEDHDEGERQFMEVAEYVRMGVLTVFAEFNRPQAPASPSLH